MAVDYNINYEDERFQKVESDKQAALSEAEKTYGGMIDQSEQYYQAQIDASREWADKQQEMQQANTDFALEQIEQQKEQAEKDYQKEQSGAYTDWQKQSSQYGVNAEQMAAGGLANTGYSESSQVSMYNTYQNRVAAARESYNKAVLNYDNAIKDAQLQNNSVLAEIAYQALQQQLELSLQGFQYKNQLILERENRKQALEDTYYGRYQDVLNQMNTENALAEQVRQYNENLALQREQLQYQKEQDERNYQLQLQQLAEEKRQFNASQAARGASGGGSGSSSISKTDHAVSTDYYQGDLNSDASVYGTFSNGYQPKGISGYGKVSKTGETVELNTVTLSGQSRTVTQNVWKTPDGTLWYWEGRENQYKKLGGTSGLSALKGAVGSSVARMMAR